MSALLVQGAAALAVVAGLAYARRCVRSRLGNGKPPELEIIERRALGRDSGVAVIWWRGQEVLVGFSGSGVTPLQPLSRFDALAAREGQPLREDP